MRGSEATQTQRVILPDPAGTTEIGHRAAVSSPYQPHSAYPGTPVPAAPGAKPRPSAAWFGVGITLILVAAVFAGVGIGRLVHTVTHREAEFSGAGLHRVTLTPHATRAVFLQTDARHFRCTAVDGSGQRVRFDRPDGTTSYGTWRWAATFDTGDGRLTFRCTSRGEGTVRIQGLPSVGMVFSTLFLGILLPLLLGGAGFVVLLVTTILWIARPRAA
jgi:hypothetical protein